MAYQRKTFECEACGKRTPNALAIRISGGNYCSTCAEALDVMACEECDCLLHPEDVRTSGDKQLCSDCLEATYKHCCVCDIILEPDYMGNTENMVDGDHYCQSCYEQTFYTCTECGELVCVDDVQDNIRHESLCMDCFEELCVVCSGCGDTIWLEDAQDYGDDYLCDDCYQDDYDCCSFGLGWSPRQFNPDSNAYRRIGSRRQFGLELEYNGAPNANQSEDALRHFGCKDEHCGVEFYSSILQGDRGLSTVEDLAHFATDNNWRINLSCGYHLHLDMRGEANRKAPSSRLRLPQDLPCLATFRRRLATEFMFLLSTLRMNVRTKSEQ